MSVYTTRSIFSSTAEPNRCIARLYYTLKTALVLFNLTDINLAVGYDTRAADLAEPILEHLWDE